MDLEKKLVLKSTYEEVERLEGLLTTLQTHIGFNDELYARLMLTVSEAATNGIVHGNKLDKSKSLTIIATFDGAILSFTIQDEGEGFTPSEVPNPLAEENLLKPSGRGIFLMKEYADEVLYADGGNTLILKFEVPS
ncbi:MAG: ATP-binding protein [Balneolaceae bacterium]